MKRRLTALFLLAAAFAAGGAGVGTTAKSPVATASAYAVTIVVPGQRSGSAAVASAAGGAESDVAGGFAYPPDGSIVRTSGASARAAAEALANPRAHAAADVLGVALFGGEITFGSAGARAEAGRATDTAGSFVTNLVVLGQSVAAVPNARFALADWGFLVTLEGGGSSAAAGGIRDSRVGVTGVRVTLTAEHAGLPAGTEILIAHAEAATAAPFEPATSAARATSTTTKTAPAPATRKAPRRAIPKPLEPGTNTSGIGKVKVRPVPPDIRAAASPGGYVFPVYGLASFTDTYGSPRAGATWHHGEDIFAPLGAPVLAVADGTVFSVGWNDVGGLRLWLRDGQGNQFYYAHLSAFSPLAAEDRRVKAGDVIGFVGSTGDAEGTPPHLHFEIHPVALLPMGYDGVVRAYPYLTAWRRLQDVSLAAGRGWAPPVPATATPPQAGALLLGGADISSVSGLEPGALERALVAPVASESDGAPLRR